jgi:hypothetical protein
MIINTESDNDKVTSVIKNLKDLFGSIPKTILLGNNENSDFVKEIKEMGVVKFMRLPITIPQIFDFIGSEKRKMNIAMVNMASEDFEELNKCLQEKGFHLMFYTASNKLYEELKNSFFDVLLVNVKIETNIADFHDKLQQDKPNIGAIYILNDDKNLESLKEKGCFYITKPFEIDKIVSLINQILGK